MSSPDILPARPRRKVALLALFGVIVCGGVDYIGYLDREHNPERLASMLRLTAAPSSLRNIECPDQLSPTDVIVVCSFDIDSSQFGDLLKGREFQIEARYGSSADMARTAGPTFRTAVRYWVELTESQHGGLVEIVGNDGRTHGVAHYYEE